MKWNDVVIFYAIEFHSVENHLLLAHMENLKTVGIIIQWIIPLDTIDYKKANIKNAFDAHTKNSFSTLSTVWLHTSMQLYNMLCFLLFWVSSWFCLRDFFHVLVTFGLLIRNLKLNLYK